MNIHIKRLSVAVFIIVAILVSACGTTEQTPVPSDETAERSRAVVAIPVDIGSMDPREATHTNNTGICGHVFSTLLKADEKYELVCDVAESYELVDDTTYRFTLKKGVLFHDGVEMTTKDVKYTFDTLRKEDATYRLAGDFSFMYIEEIDDHSFYLHTDEPNVSATRKLPNVKILPKHYVEKVGDAEFASAPIGSGPYKFTSWTKDDAIELEAFNDYFGGKPAIDTVVFKIIPESSARVSALQAGEVDLITAVPTSQVEYLSKTENLEVSSVGTTRLVYLTMNTLKEGSPMQDVRVRKAVNHAIDRNALINGLLDGYALPASNLALDIFDYYDGSIKGYDYDQEKAKELLDEAGYPNGFSAELSGAFGSLSNGADVAQAIAAQLGEIGIVLTVNEKDNNTVKEEYLAGTTTELVLTSFGGNYNHIVFMAKTVVGSGQRYSAYSDTELDDLLSKVEITIVPDKSQEVHSELQQYIVDNAIVVPLYQSNSLFAYNERLVDWVPRVDEIVMMDVASIR